MQVTKSRRSWISSLMDVFWVRGGLTRSFVDTKAIEKKIIAATPKIARVTCHPAASFPLPKYRAMGRARNDTIVPLVKANTYLKEETLVLSIGSGAFIK